MADERIGSRNLDARKTFSWMELFRTFLIALDPFKLLVAAAGIMATALGWSLISLIFHNAWNQPKPDNRDSDINDRKNAYVKDGKDEKNAQTRATTEYDIEIARYSLMERLSGPGGAYRTMPWSENRGRNPFLMTREAVSQDAAERHSALARFADQAHVLVEPLLKFLGPVLNLFDPAANFWVQLYLIFLILWLLLVWGFCGGVITRMAIVQIAGKEGSGLRDAVRFVRSRYLSYLSSPMVPLLLIFAVVIGCMFYGLLHLIPLFGDIVVDGLFWWIPMGAGFIMALLVVGLVGYPLMYSTISAEGSDTFDALSRSYNYVYESPWNYIWYSFVAIVYGAVVVFFVVFMSSLMVYLGKWGVSRTPLTQTVNRAPEYLFIYSPTSFGWRELMLKGSPVEITKDPAKAGVTDKNLPYPPPEGYLYTKPESATEYMREYSWYNYAGAGMVAFWMTLLFMLMLGFSYSYFWTASSMIYLLMRKKVDEVETDEIYTEEENFEEPISPPKVGGPAPAASNTVLVDAPTLRMPPATHPAPPPTSPPPPATPSPAAEVSTPAPILFPGTETTPQSIPDEPKHPSSSDGGGHGSASYPLAETTPPAITDAPKHPPEGEHSH